MEDAKYQAVQVHTYRLAEEDSDVEALIRAIQDVSPEGPNAGKPILFVPGKGSAADGAYDCDPWRPQRHQL